MPVLSWARPPDDDALIVERVSQGPPRFSCNSDDAHALRVAAASARVAVARDVSRDDAVVFGHCRERADRPRVPPDDWSDRVADDGRAGRVRDRDAALSAAESS